jgi:AcrR family transcriptional regulator
MERRAGRPSGDHEMRRQIVAEAVWSVLRDHGPDGASLRAVAREAGCTTGTLVHYFRDKDEMLLFSISHMLDRIESRIAALRVPGAPLASIRAIARALLPQTPETVLEWSAWLGFISRGQWVPEIGELRARRARRIRNLVHEILGEAEAAGHLASGLDLRDRADAIVASVEGICIMSTELEGEDDARRRERLLDRMLDLLLPSSETGPC